MPSEVAERIQSKASWLREIPHSKSFLACLKDFSSYKLTPIIFRVRWGDWRHVSWDKKQGETLPLEIGESFSCVCHICEQINSQWWPQDWKRSVFILTLKKSNAKESSNYHTITRISHASKIMLKILQARLQLYMNWEGCILSLICRVYHVKCWAGWITCWN